MVVDTRLPVMPAVTVDRQITPASVSRQSRRYQRESCRDQRCINHRTIAHSKKINAYRNGVAILVPRIYPTCVRFSQYWRQILRHFDCNVSRCPSGRFCGSRTEGRPRQRDLLYAIAHRVRARNCNYLRRSTGIRVGRNGDEMHVPIIPSRKPKL